MNVKYDACLETLQPTNDVSPLEDLLGIQNDSSVPTNTKSKQTKFPKYLTVNFRTEEDFFAFCEKIETQLSLQVDEFNFSEKGII